MEYSTAQSSPARGCWGAATLPLINNGWSLERFPSRAAVTISQPQQRRDILRIKTLIVAAAALAAPAYAAAQAPAQDHSQHQPAAGTAAATTATVADASATVGPVQLAAKEDIKTGATVIDQQGGSVGTIETVNAEGAVIATGKARVQLPLGSFGKSPSGLVIGMTKAELEAAAVKGG